MTRPLLGIALLLASGCATNLGEGSYWAVRKSGTVVETLSRVARTGCTYQPSAASVEFLAVTGRNSEVIFRFNDDVLPKVSTKFTERFEAVARRSAGWLDESIKLDAPITVIVNGVESPCGYQIIKKHDDANRIVVEIFYPFEQSDPGFTQLLMEGLGAAVHEVWHLGQARHIGSRSETEYEAYVAEICFKIDVMPNNLFFDLPGARPAENAGYAVRTSYRAEAAVVERFVDLMGGSRIRGDNAALRAKVRADCSQFLVGKPDRQG